MANEILKIVPTLQATALVGANLKKLKKKKLKTKDVVEMGVGNIVGAALIKETSDFINS